VAQSRRGQVFGHTLAGVGDMAAEQGSRSESRYEPAAGANGAASADGALEAIAEASRAAVDAPTLAIALDAIVAAAARATGAELVLARALDADGLSASVRAVCARSPALAAELEGSRIAADDLASAERDGTEDLPDAVRDAAARIGAEAVLQLPVLARARVAGTLELFRSAAPFSAEERILARLAAAHVGAALRALGPAARDGIGVGARGQALTLAGEALAAGFDEDRTAEEVVRLAAEATGARRAVLWRSAAGELEPALTFGPPLDGPELQRARDLAEHALEARRPVELDKPGEGRDTVATIQLGHPLGAALQLTFGEEAEADDSDVSFLATFGVRAAHALRAGARARVVALELERTRSLMTIVAEANAQLSLAHTLATVVDRVAELLAVERIAVYLREEDRLLPAAGRALAGPHAPVAERLLTLALGRFRSRGVIVVADCRADHRFAGLERELEEAGIEAAVAAPLLVPGEITGLLAVFPRRGVELDPNELELLSALAAQLAVAVQNARLHEQATELGAELEEALAAERQAAARVRSLYEISRSFAQSLSLETTLDAVARSISELLGVDAAVIRMPDERGELLIPRAIHVADDTLRDSVRAILSRPQPIDKLPGRRNFRTGRPLVLDAETARSIGPPHSLLAPFLDKGSTAVVLPIATPGELLGTLKLLSLDPARPITEETIELGLSVAAQAALAIENARLYQQQKAFFDAMQRSLLPREEPELPGLDVGVVYESSARVDVGGDVYDFVEVDGGRLAVVLGDVTGHGIDAAADMAMAKFVFRSLAREHPEPGDFLASANAVVCDEIAPGKFITMLYLVADPAAGELSCASGGHPSPRLVTADGEVRGIEVRGLALGIEPGQPYDEVHEPLPPGASVVLYTDGVIEARRDGELYGIERLDALLAARRDLPVKELAEAVRDSCRAFAGGELSDDCAVVVIRRTSG
jgi:serine phosphatase RsbU (regulator of sigma subunit)